MFLILFSSFFLLYGAVEPFLLAWPSLLLLQHSLLFRIMVGIWFNFSLSIFQPAISSPLMVHWSIHICKILTFLGINTFYLAIMSICNICDWLVGEIISLIVCVVNVTIFCWFYCCGCRCCNCSSYSWSCSFVVAMI